MRINSVGHAIFHVFQPDGSVIANCDSFPGWACHIKKDVRNRRAVSEESLRQHIQNVTSFAHFEVPLENNHLKPVA